MQSEQNPLFRPPPKARRVDDFLGLFPQKVMPTGGIHVLERNGRLLLIKSYDHGALITKAQERVFRLFVGLGEMETAPGSITVACVWGKGAATREVVIYDHTGVSSKKEVPLAQFRDWLRRWWEDRL